MIRIYTGKAGSGKTVNMLEDARRKVVRDRCKVYTNMVGLKFPESVCIANVKDLAYIGRGLVILDEASVCLASRYWQQLDRSVLSALAQHRKHGLDVYTTAQHIDRVETVLRELANEEMRCMRWGRRWYLLTLAEPGKRLPYGTSCRMLPPTTYALYDTYEKIAYTGAGGAASPVGNSPEPTYARLRDRRRLKDIDGTVFRRSVSRRQIGGNVYRLDRAATLTPETLASMHGTTVVGPYSLLGAGLQRYRHTCEWLRCFNLTPADVAPGVDYDHPWLPGYDPVTMMEAAKDRELEEELAAAAAKQRVTVTRKGAESAW